VKSESEAATLRIAFPASGTPRIGAGGWTAVPMRSGATKLPASVAAPFVLVLDLAEWESDDFPFQSFDRQVEAMAQAACAAECGGRGETSAAGSGFAIEIRGASHRLDAAARQVMERCQRLAGRRNAASRGGHFERALDAHRGLYDVSQPAGAAAHARALDTWQWLLRLDPEAGLAPQLAALFRGLGRTASGAAGELAGARSEEAWGRDLRRGAMTADEVCAELGIDLATRVLVHRLIDCRRPPAAGRSATAAAAALDAARALSFFSLDAAARLADCGFEWTARAARHHLTRLTPRGRAHLETLRLPAALGSLLRRGAASSRPAAAESRQPQGSRTAQAPGARGASGDDATRAAAGRGSATGPSGPGNAERPATALALTRSRMAAGLLGADGFARTRVGALLARAAAIGALYAVAVGPASASQAVVQVLDAASRL
jgi:hypothetical protein